MAASSDLFSRYGWLARQRHIDLVRLLGAAVGPLGIAFGRIASFFNGG